MVFDEKQFIVHITRILYYIELGTWNILQELINHYELWQLNNWTGTATGKQRAHIDRFEHVSACYTCSTLRTMYVVVRHSISL